jgi:hypothetical protein
VNIVNPESYYLVWKGKVLPNKWELINFLKRSNSDWTWQRK